MERRLLASGVTDETVHDDGLRDLLPAARSRTVPRHPGPGGLRGGLAAPGSRPPLLASRGYAALALAYFNYEHLPLYLHAIPLEYFETALHWLQRRPEVRADRMAVLGYSRGGELALLLGSTFPALTAVVGYVPSGVVHGSIGVVGGPAWTYRGEPVPYLFPPDAARHEEVVRQEPVALAPWYLGNLEDGEAVARATIPVERINGPCCCCRRRTIRCGPHQCWPTSHPSGWHGMTTLTRSAIAGTRVLGTSLPCPT